MYNGPQALRDVQRLLLPLVQSKQYGYDARCLLAHFLDTEHGKHERHGGQNRFADSLIFAGQPHAADNVVRDSQLDVEHFSGDRRIRCLLYVGYIFCQCLAEATKSYE